MTRTDIINLLIQKYDYQSYLEIGTQNPDGNFNKINVKNKVSIEPFAEPGVVSFVGTSDEYFAQLASDVRFDIVFIDGLHQYEQVLKDIDNSLNHLSDNGTIVVHDCLPTAEYQTSREDNHKEWTGDVWKAIAEMRTNCIDISIQVVATDWGCGIIRKGTNIPYQPVIENYLTFSYYMAEHDKMLNIISVNEFINQLQNG